MKISLIAAMSENRVIGHGNDIPWKIPEEQTLFRRYTMGCRVIMGRKTYESIGKPLDGRLNIVVTQKTHYEAPGCVVVHSIEEGLNQGGGYADEVFVIGGESLFRETIPMANRIYLTRILITIPGDTFFPEFNPDDFIEIKREDYPGPPPYVFSLYQRIMHT